MIYRSESYPGRSVAHPKEKRPTKTPMSQIQKPTILVTLDQCNLAGDPVNILQLGFDHHGRILRKTPLRCL
jgi:hypothetical protein